PCHRHTGSLRGAGVQRPRFMVRPLLAFEPQADLRLLPGARLLRGVRVPCVELPLTAARALCSALSWRLRPAPSARPLAASDPGRPGLRTCATRLLGRARCSCYRERAFPALLAWLAGCAPRG